MSAIAECHGCPHRAKHCAGPCPCTIDGRDIVAHANSTYCPHPDGPRFGDGSKPMGWDDTPIADRPEPRGPRPGDVIKHILEHLGYEQTAQGLRCRNGHTVSDCGCRAMQNRMNQLGWFGCLRERRELMEWFKQKASECGVSVDARTILRLLSRALRARR